MRRLNQAMTRAWLRVGPEMLPFADVATKEVSLQRFLRLSLFQVSVGMAAVLLTGTLNRVMIVELAVPAWLVALMVSLPLLFAPLRALIGFRSDVYQSALGWRRVPFMWMGTLLQFGGFAILPFALLIMSGDTHGPVVYGKLAAALAFLLVGAGMHTTQTAGLALATDLAEEKTRPRVVALLFIMLLIGMFLSALIFGYLLSDFSQLRLIKVIQGAAVVTMLVNLVALWKQEPRHRRAQEAAPQARFRDALRTLREDRRAMRLLVSVALGTAAFAMQDVLLEPFGAQILGLSVGGTTSLTALLAGGMLIAFAVAARQLNAGFDAYRLSAYGAMIGIIAFAIVTFVGALRSELLFAAGVSLIGFGSGLFAVGTLTATMTQSRKSTHGLALGAWGAVQATAAGIAIGVGGALRDAVSSLAAAGVLGPALKSPATGYAFVYQLEIVLLFATLVAIGPLAATIGRSRPSGSEKLGLADFPGQ